MSGGGWQQPAQRRVLCVCLCKVEGGSNPRSAEFYHPFVITDEPMGGYDRLSEKQKDEVRVLAGVEFTRSVSAMLTGNQRLRIRIRFILSCWIQIQV
jgi:hypothetical protein